MYASTRNPAQLETSVLNIRTGVNTALGACFGVAFGLLHDSVRLTSSIRSLAIGTTALAFTHNCWVAWLKKHFTGRIPDRYFLWNCGAGGLNLGLWMVLSLARPAAVNPLKLPYYVASVALCNMTVMGFVEFLRVLLLRGPRQVQP
jgi:hypothetical protein